MLCQSSLPAATANRAVICPARESSAIAIARAEMTPEGWPGFPRRLAKLPSSHQCDAAAFVVQAAAPFALNCLPDPSFGDACFADMFQIARLLPAINFVQYLVLTGRVMRWRNHVPQCNSAWLKCRRVFHAGFFRGAMGRCRKVHSSCLSSRVASCIRVAL